MVKKAVMLVIGSHQGAVFHALEGLSVKIMACKTLGQAQEIMSLEDVQMIFCEEILPDASFREVVAMAARIASNPRVVVIFRVGEWPEYLEALALGAFEVIPCPIRAVDVESAAVRAIQGMSVPARQPDYQRISA